MSGSVFTWAYSCRNKKAPCLFGIRVLVVPMARARVVGGWTRCHEQHRNNGVEICRHMYIIDLEINIPGNRKCEWLCESTTTAHLLRSLRNCKISYVVDFFSSIGFSTRSFWDANVMAHNWLYATWRFRFVWNNVGPWGVSRYDFNLLENIDCLSEFWRWEYRSSNSGHP